MTPENDHTLFPVLTPAEMNLLRPFAGEQKYEDGSTIFQAGEAALDLFVVQAGAIDIRNPAENNRIVVTQRQGQFTGDIDLLTGRPVVVSGIANGPTCVLRVPHAKVRILLNRIPSLGEKLITALTRRREVLSQCERLGISVVGGGHCPATNIIREFLYKNFVPFSWVDADSEEGQEVIARHDPESAHPIVDCNGQILFNPPLRELADCAGIWRECPQGLVDLAIVGSGPGGIAAAVYAASEGLSTLLIDRLGPGGQAGGSSKIENFIGFPAGLSGAELATRGVLQMLKFGGKMVAPVNVDKLEIPEDPKEPRLLHLDCGAVVPAKVVLIATGVEWRKLPVDGAEQFESGGIHYVCTAVEADLYDKCDVIVIGGGNSAGQAAMHLADCCPERQVHLIVRSPLGSSMSEYLVSRIRDAANITVHEGCEVSKVEGGQRLESATIRGKDGSEKLLACSGIFVFIGAIPSAEWLPKGIARDDLGYIMTGTEVANSGQWPLSYRDPCPLETTIPGVLAAGDVRSGTTKRVGFAVGDGSLAVTCVHHLLSSP